MTLMMGVSGIRGIVGQTMTADLVRQAGAGFASWLARSRPAPPPHLVVARDSRPSGAEFLSCLIAELLEHRCRVTDLGIVSTPCTARAVRRLQADGGMLLTASHNPAAYNGIKFLTLDGSAPDARTATAILDEVRRAVPAVKGAPAAPSVRAETPAGREAVEDHVRATLETVDAERIRACRFTVVLDSVCGAGAGEGRGLLEALGCRVISLHAEPTGRFPHPPEPLEENLVEVAEEVRKAKASIGFAQDPDADRLAIIDEHSAYVGEEYTLALYALNLLGQHPGVAVANLSTSRMIDDVAAGILGCRVERSAVGEANVVERMRAAGAVLGGEGNGGVIDPRVGWTRDSLVAMAQVLELTARRGQPLSQILASLPRYRILKAKLDVPPGGPGPMLQRVRDHFRNERLSDVDGIRIDRGDGWIHVRGSNTEPIIRIIAEARDDAAAQALIDEVKRLAG